MKISEFAREHGLKKETIRYYTELGLLIPEKISNYYNYNDQCTKDLHNIIKLKDYEFSLMEILKIISYIRLVGTTEEEDVSLFEIIENKKNQLIMKKELLEKKIVSIDNVPRDIKIGTNCNDRIMGIDVKFLHILSCPKCKNQLSIVDSRIDGSILVEGYMKCQCGYKGSIKDGILICSDANEDSYNPHNKVKTNLSNIQPELISLLKRTSNYIKKEMINIDLRNKVVLDLGADIPMVTSDLLELVDKNTLYIINSSSVSDAKFKQQQIINNSNIKNIKNIIFTAGINEMPIKQNLIDVIVDGYATSFRFLVEDKGYLEYLYPYLKNNAVAIGLYFGYKKEVKSLENINPNASKYFIKKELLNYFKLNRFQLEAYKEWKGIKNTGHALNFHNHEETINFWAVKWKYSS